jgi:cytochrome b involved in lipid metabolism
MKQVKQHKVIPGKKIVKAKKKKLCKKIGKDATEAFEDIGHSDEAREILEKYFVGELDEAVSFFALQALRIYMLT